MSGTIMPAPWFTALDDNGVTIVGAKLYTYVAGTSVPQYTYADSELQVPNPNPVVCDGAGRATVYLAASTYKFVLKDANDVTIRTQDNIAANAAFSADLDIAGLAGENLPAGSVAYLSVGAEAPPLTAGRWYLADASLAVSSTAAEFIAMVQGTVTTGNVGAFRLQGRTQIPNPPGPLTIGATYYVSTTAGVITTPIPGDTAFHRVVGIADSLNTLVTATGFGAGLVVSGDINTTGSISVGGQAVIGGDLFTTGFFVAQGDTNAIYPAKVININTGNAAGAGWVVDAGANTQNGLYALNQNYAPLPGDDANKPSGVTLFSNGSGGLSIYNGGAGGTRFYTSGVLRGAMFPSGGFNWGLGTTDPGAGPGGSGWISTVGLLVNRLVPFATQLGNLQVKAFTSAGWDGIHIQLDQDVVNGRFLQFFNQAGVPQGSISATNATTTAYNTASDQRLKIDLGIPLETRVLPSLIVHDFQWKADGTVGRGLFAQEAATVLPAAVTPGCEGPVVDEPWMVDYSKVVPDLIVGWQQHEARLVALLERLEAVESRHDGKQAP